MSIFQEISQYGSQTAIITEAGEKISYNQLIGDSEIYAQCMPSRCLIFIICSNTYEAIVGYVGALRNHIVPVLIHEGMDSELYSKLLTSYWPQYIFKPHQQEVIGEEVVFKIGQYDLVKTSYIVDYTLNEELALLLTTSGSTGSPKLVRQSYNNLLANAESIVEYLSISNTDRPITTLPMHYTYGLSIINSHLICGASIILTNKSLMEKEFWELLKSEQATTFGGVPYSYEILQKLRFDKMELPSLKLLTQAGGKLSEPLAMYFATLCREKNIKFYIMYGQTEATARMAYLPCEYVLKKPTSIGIAIPGGSFQLLDSNNQVIQNACTTGELIYKGENVTLGYACHRFDLQRGDDNKGILYTGDMAKRDEEDFYYIVGRKKRFLKLFGNRVNLDELEAILKAKGFDCACGGQDDHLIVYTTREDKETIRHSITQHTSIVPGGFEVKQIEKIPRNESGKILYSEL